MYRSGKIYCVDECAQTSMCNVVEKIKALPDYDEKGEVRFVPHTNLCKHCFVYTHPVVVGDNRCLSWLHSECLSYNCPMP